MSFTQSNSRPMRVLTAVRPGKGETPSLTRLKTFSRTTDVEALLYCAIYDPHLSSWRSMTSAHDEDVMKFLIEHEKSNLDALKREFGATCRCCDTCVEWQHPASTGIIQAAKNANADAVFLASSRLTQGLDYHDWDVLTQAPAPVLVCNSIEPKAYRRILVAVDPTHAHQKAASIDTQLLNEASALAELFNAETHAVHAYPNSRTYVTPEMIVPQEVIETWREEHQAAVETLLEPFRIEDVHLVADQPRAAILDTAKKIDADLIVIGASSRSCIADLIVGHTAEYVINHCECDVLCLPANSGLT